VPQRFPPEGLVAAVTANLPAIESSRTDADQLFSPSGVIDANTGNVPGSSPGKRAEVDRGFPLWAFLRGDTMNERPAAPAPARSIGGGVPSRRLRWRYPPDSSARIGHRGTIDRQNVIAPNRAPARKRSVKRSTTAQNPAQASTQGTAGTRVRCTLGTSMHGHGVPGYVRHAGLARRHPRHWVRGAGLGTSARWAGYAGAGHAGTSGAGYVEYAGTERHTSKTPSASARRARRARWSVGYVIRWARRHVRHAGHVGRPARGHEIGRWASGTSGTLGFGSPARWAAVRRAGTSCRGTLGAGTPGARHVGTPGSARVFGYVGVPGHPLGVGYFETLGVRHRRHESVDPVVPIR
jgi:hypothetical protein